MNVTTAVSPSQIEIFVLNETIGSATTVIVIVPLCEIVHAGVDGDVALTKFIIVVDV